MSDGFVDFAGDYCDHDCGRLSRGRLILKLIVAYIAITLMFLTESQFRKKGIELEAKVETVGRDRKGIMVRYFFRDPVTGTARTNTVTVREDLMPKGNCATIEYVPGEYPTSRLKVQARPDIFTVYFCVNALFLITLAGLIGYIAWEANHPIPRSSDRVSPRFKDAAKS